MTLDGLNILLIEDEPLIALDIIEMLTIAGAIVHGPARSVADASAMIAGQALNDGWDVVVLDFSLVDGTSERIAEELARSKVPFVLHSGLSEKLRPLADRLHVPLVAKPAAEGVLLHAIQDIVC